MRIIFRILSRHWLGPPGWVYVLSLALAALIYWLLPTSALIHRWELSAAYQIEGFSTVDSNLLIVSQLTNRDERFQLDTITGAIKRYATTGEESQQVISSQKMSYELSHLQLDRRFGDSPAKLTLKKMSVMGRNATSPATIVKYMSQASMLEAVQV